MNNPQDMTGSFPAPSPDTSHSATHSVSLRGRYCSQISLGLLAAMIAMSLIAALIGPRLFCHVEARKIETTRTRISLLGNALDIFHKDFGRYPTTEEGLKILWEKPGDPQTAAGWHGPYLSEAVLNDAWDNPYIYRSPGLHGAYDLTSYGVDGQPGGEGDNADIRNNQYNQ